MEIKDPIIQQIKKTREARGLSSTQLAEILKVPVDRLYKWEHGKATPKYKDRQNILNWINGKAENTSPETEQIPEPEENMQPFATKELLKAITTLTESNKSLVDSNRSITDTNRVIADTNALLAQKLINETSTAGAPADNPVVAPSTIAVLLEAIVEIGSGKRWDSKEAGIAELDKKLSQQFSSKKKKVGTQSGAGISSTGS